MNSIIIIFMKAIAAFFEVFIFARFFYKMLGKKVMPSGLMTCLNILVVALYSIVSVWSNSPIILSTTTGIGLLFLAFFCNYGTWKKKIIYSATLWIFASIAEMIVIVLVSLFYHQSLQDLIATNLVFWIEVVVLVKLIQFLLSETIVRLLGNKDTDLPLKNWLILMSIPLFSMAIVLLLSQYIAYGTSDLILAFLGLCGILIVINIAVFHLFDAFASYSQVLRENSLIKQQASLQAEHYHQMEHTFSKEASAWHDYKHQMIAVQACFQNENYFKADKLLKSLLQSGEKRAIKFIGNDAIDAVLSTKFSKAEELGIEMKHKIYVEGFLSFDPLDLCIILGNVLDNALEACKKNVTAKKIIKFQLSTVKNKFNISVENPTDQPLTYKGGDLTSSKHDPVFHGIGLKNVRAAVERCGGLMHFEVRDGVFTFNATLFIG